MKVKCLVTDEFVQAGNTYKVLEIVEDSWEVVKVEADGIGKSEFPEVYLTRYEDDPEFEVIE